MPYKELFQWIGGFKFQCKLNLHNYVKYPCQYNSYYVIVVKADEEMKREQERRVTEDKKDSVHQQLLHTV